MDTMQANVLVVEDKYNARGDCVSDGSGKAGVELAAPLGRSWAPLWGRGGGGRWGLDLVSAPPNPREKAFGQKVVAKGLLSVHRARGDRTRIYMQVKFARNKSSF